MTKLNLTRDQLRRLQLDHEIMRMEINIDLIEDRWEDREYMDDGEKGEYETIDQMRDAYQAELDRLVQEKEKLLLKMRNEDPNLRYAHQLREAQMDLVMDVATGRVTLDDNGIRIMND